MNFAKPELLAPAGDYTRFRYAVEYGADAVYVGGEEFSLRTAVANFPRADLARAVDYAHRRNVRVYVACNTVPRNDEIERFSDYLQFLKKIEVDALIVSDLGLFMMIRDECPEMELHVSTQANISNYADCLAWYRLGAKRVVLARELTFDEITQIRLRTPGSLEIEAFVQGAMCVSHSGRCLLSNFMTGRDANRGNCAQACRWKYNLVEEKRPGQYMPVEETDTGTFIFNSKDLCMIDHVPDLISAGITSFKIEGRVKTEYYVACVVAAYRRAIDACFSDLGEYERILPELREEVCKVSHRPYFTGFYYGDQKSESMNFNESGYIRDYEVSGIVTGYDYVRGCVVLSQRNKFVIGDECEFLIPGKSSQKIVVEKMSDGEGEPILAAPHPEMTVLIPYPNPVPSMSFMRRKRI